MSVPAVADHRRAKEACLSFHALKGGEFDYRHKRSVRSKFRLLRPADGLVPSRTCPKANLDRPTSIDRSRAFYTLTIELVDRLASILAAELLKKSWQSGHQTRAAEDVTAGRESGR